MQSASCRSAQGAKDRRLGDISVVAEFGETSSEGVDQDQLALFGTKAIRMRFLGFLKLGAKTTERNEFVQTGCDDWVLDAGRVIDEIEHEVEDELRIGPRQHRFESVQRDAPALRIDQEEGEGIRGNVLQDRRKDRLKVGLIGRD